MISPTCTSPTDDTENTTGAVAFAAITASCSTTFVVKSRPLFVTPSHDFISGTTISSVVPSAKPSNTLKVSVKIVPPAVVPLDDDDANANFARPAVGTANAHMALLLMIFVFTPSK